MARSRWGCSFGLCAKWALLPTTCFAVLKMTTNRGVATRSAFDRPYMIDPSPDGRTIVIQTAKKAYAGHEGALLC